MPDDTLGKILANPTAWGILFGAIGVLIYAISHVLKTSGPDMVKAWYVERVKALEYKRTREQADRVALTETFGQIFEYIRQDREQDRSERIADREEAAKLREQMTRLGENIHLLTNRLSQTNDRVLVLAQNAASQVDETRELQSEIRILGRKLEPPS